MVKQIIHILVFTTLAMILLSTIAKGQEMTYYRPADSGTNTDETENVPEEILEYIYKFDLPAEDESNEVAFDVLPTSVKSSFLKSKYGSWNVMKVLEVAQKKENVFLLLVEKGGFIETIRFNRKGKAIPGF